MKLQAKKPSCTAMNRSLSSQKIDLPPNQETLFLYKHREEGDEIIHCILGEGVVTDPIPYPGTSFRRASFSGRELCVFERSLI